jgi:AraC-like DNA-binding protein
MRLICPDGHMTDSELTEGLDVIRRLHLDEGRSVEHIAAHVGVSAKTLYRLLAGDQQGVRMRTAHLVKRFARSQQAA